jgi:hypothetical protein
MAELRRAGAIDTSEDIAAERREWRAQRIGWVLMFLFVAAGAAGLFGGGPFAATVSRAGALRVEHDRVARQQASAALTIEAPAENHNLRLWLGREFLAAVDLETITPEPERSVLHADRAVYEFAADGPVEITIRYRHERLGRVRCDLGVEGGEALSFQQLVLP